MVDQAVAEVAAVRAQGPAPALWVVAEAAAAVEAPGQGRGDREAQEARVVTVGLGRVRGVATERWVAVVVTAAERAVPGWEEGR